MASIESSHMLVVVRLPKHLNSAEERLATKAKLETSGLSVTEDGPLLEVTVPNPRLAEIESLVSSTRAEIVYKKIIQ